MTRTTVRRLAIGGALLVALGTTGCSPSTGGPLVGPRVEADTVGVCTPASAGPQVYFGEVLTNTGSSDVTITTVTGDEQGVESVEFLMDTAGPELGEFLGAGGLPATEPLGNEEEIFDRATPAAGTVIPADTAASLLILVTPDADASDAGVSPVTVDYDARGESFREEILVDYTVAGGDGC